MQIELLKGKLHRATLTGCEIDYSGSLSIDRDLLTWPGFFVEKILVVNQTTDSAFLYAIEAARGSREFCLNGAAARLGIPGDMVTIMAFALVDPAEASGWKPKVVVLADQNRQVKVLR